MTDQIETLEQFWAAAERLDPDGWAKSKAAQDELAALSKDAERYRWLRDNPRWAVGYRTRPRTGAKEWRMFDDGEYWGSWWPTHEQAIDHAMKLDAAVAAARAVGV